MIEENISMIEEEEAMGKALSDALKKSDKGECLTMEEIASLVDGSVDRNKRDEMMNHLSVCDKCYDIFLISSEIKDKSLRKRHPVLNPVGLAASVLIVAFLAFLVYKSGFFPKPEDKLDDISKISESYKYTSPKTEPGTFVDEEKEEEKKTEEFRRKDADSLKSKSKKGGPEILHKKGEGEGVYKKGYTKKLEPRKRLDTAGKSLPASKSRAKMDEKDGEKKGISYNKEIQKMNEAPKEPQVLKRSVKTFDKDKAVQKKAPVRKPEPGLKEKSSSEKPKTVHKQEVEQREVSMNVVQTAGIPETVTGKDESVVLSSTGQHVFCSGKIGDAYTLYLEHKSDVPVVEKPPAVVNKVLPDKELLKQYGLKGTVVLEVEIDKRGNVTRACAFKGDPQLARLYVEEVLKWKYEPKRIGGIPAAVRFSVTIDYK